MNSYSILMTFNGPDIRQVELLANGATMRHAHVCDGRVVDKTFHENCGCYSCSFFTVETTFGTLYGPALTLFNTIAESLS